MKSNETKSKTSLQPRLRFPEFEGDGDWRATILGKLSEVVRGGSPRPIDSFLTTAIDGLNWLKIGDVDKEAKFITQTSEKVRREALNKTRVVDHGDLILSNSMSFGRPYILRIKTCIHDGWIAITSIINGIDRDFLYYFISATGSQSYFLDNAAGSGVQNLNADIIKTLPVHFSSKVEQQKIADCLSSLDELIEAEDQKLEALQRHKKGLMQELFPAEGQTLPKRRFPEFHSTPEWSEKPLRELLLSPPEYGVNAPAVPFSPDLPAYLRITDISEDGRFLSKKKASVAIKVTDQHYLADGDIALARTGASVGKSYKFRSEDGRLVFAGFLIRVRPNPSKLNSTFLFNFFSTKQYWKWVAITSARSGQPGINGNEYASLVVPVPAIKEEQQRIADFLSSVDNLITSQTKKLESLRLHKKGLMQQLFPNAGEEEKFNINTNNQNQ
jgi:type I restriction enzyme, S subunit